MTLQNRTCLKKALDYVKEKTDEKLPAFRDTFPAPNSENLVYPQWENIEWTPGFYTGMLWLLYEETKEQKYLDALEPLLATFQKRLEVDTTLDTHDIGFLYSLSTLAGYKVLGDEQYLSISQRAADRLMNRYHPKARIIQAWGVYGFALSYAHTKELSFLETAMKIADYYLERLPEDYVPYWDLYFKYGDQYRDSSAACILACGLLEIGKHLPFADPKKKIYEETAIRIVRSLAENYTTKGEHSNGILKHAVYSIPHNNGVDECCIWGDYFYLEALIRLSRPWRVL